MDKKTYRTIVSVQAAHIRQQAAAIENLSRANEQLWDIIAGLDDQLTKASLEAYNSSILVDLLLDVAQ